MLKHPSLLILSLLIGWVVEAQAQHVHVNAGALALTPGSPLLFANADQFATNSGYIFNLNVRLSGPAVGLYDGGPTFTALAIDPNYGGPEPSHALPGTKIAVEVVSLDGPKDGSLSFWESPDCEISATKLTFTLPIGQAPAGARFPLSQNGGQADADPYGHCHGRRYTTSVPGLYTLGLRLVDDARNGVGGTPMHAPSEITYFYYQAGVTLHTLEKTEQGMLATFGSKAVGNYFLEASAGVGADAVWETVAGPVEGDGHLQSLLDPTPSGELRFYRLRYETP